MPAAVAPRRQRSVERMRKASILAALALSSTRPLALGRRMPIGLAAPLLVALPFLFLHRDFQPGYSVHGVGVELSDLLVLAVAVGVVLALRRDRLAPPWARRSPRVLAALFPGLPPPRYPR